MSPSDDLPDYRKRKRRYWTAEPPKGTPFRYPVRCPDPRCGEDIVIAIPHPGDETQTPNRCPTCMATVVSLWRHTKRQGRS